MPGLELFPKDRVVGVFRGFTEGGLEFHADLVLPYRSDFQCTPMHGQFMLVQLETPDEAVLGRIASFSAEGRLTYGVGEEFNIRAMKEERSIPEELREQYLKYRVNIRVLGVVRMKEGKVVFVASQRRLPHVGSPVAFLGDDVLQEVAGHCAPGVGLGHFALGEYVYAGSSREVPAEDWMQVLSPEVLVKFDVTSLVSRRTFVFARAGFGKSNLNKLLFSSLYKTKPAVRKRGRSVPVGTVLFDPEGEYFWPDDQGRPGFCDVPELVDQVVVFTSRKPPSPYYGSFVVSEVKLDIRRLRPSDVISIALSPEKQDQQNVRKLKGLQPDRWARLVDLIDKHGNDAPLEEISKILSLDDERQSVEALAARGNMTSIVRMLHSRSSQLLDMLFRALEEGKLCIVDLSQMRGAQSLVFSGLILRRIFDRNQEQFTEAEPKTIPTIAVVEEAQSVLVEGAGGAEPYVTWVKEGRKYDLGAVLITQQPGSIPHEILSQGDNWFVFHLLSSVDLQNVRRTNAHFSEDLLSSLLNEPIRGHAVFWSSVAGKPYPLSIRVLSFEAKYPVWDPQYSKDPIDCYAARLREGFARELSVAEGLRAGELEEEEVIGGSGPEPDESEGSDPLALFKKIAILAVQEDERIMAALRGAGYSWGGLKYALKEHLPEMLTDRDQVAYDLVPEFLNETFGEGGWVSFKYTKTGKTYAKAKP